MKKSKFLFCTLPLSLFILGMSSSLSSCAINEEEDLPGLDTALYDDNDDGHALFDHPDIRYENDDDDEEDDVVVDKVILHYYNEAGGCDGRAFYLWVTGVDGAEYNFNNASDIMEVNADNTMMTITIDFTDPRFVDFTDKSSLFFIIKFKKISETQLNWGGQSDDMQLVYKDFPPEAGSTTCEVWTMPAAGGGIAILDSEAKTRVHGIKLAKFTDWKTIECKLTDATPSVKWKLYAFDETYYKVKAKKRADIQKWYLVKEGVNNGDFNINLPYDAHINVVYSLVSHDPSTDTDPDMAELDKTATVSFENLYNTAKFHQYYESTTKDLGCTVESDKITFRVWSPVSANMTLMVYDKDTSAEYAPSGLSDTEKAAYNKYNGYHMKYTSGGVWELTFTGEDIAKVKGKYYNYQVDNSIGTNVVMDPYATSAGACGVRGYVYDKADPNANPEGWDSLPVKWDGVEGLDLATPQDLSIYEVHIQDFTGDSSWISHKGNKNGTYNAFVESGTKVDGTEVTTGYDHLNELGVNAVQLNPVFDHDNDESGETLKYNWGYNPLNYNVVEGGYSSNAHDGLARVKEFKNLVLKLSQTEAHTRVIMDVVYNHVSSATGSNFHKLMPRYYFRYDANGELFDGSGCHNEVATDRPMMRKFIIDSLKMWATEYKVKGFRFDLMGLIDFKTMIEAKKELYKIDPDIYIYGEGWTSGGYHGEGSSEWWSANPGATDPHNYGASTWQIYNECNNFITDGVYLGGFNDAFRNAVRGGNGTSYDGKNYPDSGWIQQGNWKNRGGDDWYCDYGPLDTIADGLWGTNSGVNTDGVKTGYYPEQTINYVSCHDNWTLRDQLYNTLKGSEAASAEDLLHASLQAHAMLFASNSASLMLGGEELLRTKELTDEDLANKDYSITADSWTTLHGHHISHNSYNAPLSVNSFKWRNKIEIKVDNTSIKNEDFNYNEAWKTIVKSHKNFLKKRGTNDGYNAFMSSTSEGSGVMNRYWSQDGNFSNCVAFQANEGFIYTCSGNVGSGDYIQCDQNAMENVWDHVFTYGNMSISDNKVYFGRTNSVGVYDRHGK